MGVWVYGCMSVLVYRCMGAWVYECMRATVPHLGRGFTIVSEAQDIRARLKVGGNLNHIAHGNIVPVSYTPSWVYMCTGEWVYRCMCAGVNG